MDEKKVVTFDFKQAIEQLQMPLIFTSANPAGMCFLIDTGSTHNVLCDYVYEALKDQITDSDEKFNFFGVEGQKRIVNRASMTLNICNQDYDACFNIANLSGSFEEIEKQCGIQLHGIIGIDFLVKNKWTLDFATQQVVIPKKAA